MALPEPHRVDRVEHETLTFERQLKAPKEAVFDAFSDAVARAKWASPSPTAVVIYDSENFIENGKMNIAVDPRMTRTYMAEPTT